MTMSETTYEAAPAADMHSASTAPIIHRVWPIAAFAFGVGLTAAWVGLLGYGVVRVIGFAF